MYQKYLKNIINKFWFQRLYTLESYEKNNINLLTFVFSNDDKSLNNGINLDLFIKQSLRYSFKNHFESNLSNKTKIVSSNLLINYFILKQRESAFYSNIRVTRSNLRQYYLDKNRIIFYQKHKHLCYGLNKKLRPLIMTNLKKCDFVLMSADWINDFFVENLKKFRRKKSIDYYRIIVKSLFLTSYFFLQYRKLTPLRGLKIEIKGRLKKTKERKRQKIMKSIGKVPLNSIDSNVDYSQRILRTKLGIVSIKIWSFYELNTMK